LIGKTSLLNALCGRAFYGQVSGEVHLNGQPTAIEEIKDSVGFVPQVSLLETGAAFVLHPVLTYFFECGSKDDIVFAELTVKENLIFSGKFRLPKETPANIIEDLADETLANLGLSRVANSLVGDVKRRGVSGGEKKRVNIGLEVSWPRRFTLPYPSQSVRHPSHPICQCVNASLWPIRICCF
jgi:ABC-type multidrug transport system ATPase subunit